MKRDPLWSYVVAIALTSFGLGMFFAEVTAR